MRHNIIENYFIKIFYFILKLNYLKAMYYKLFKLVYLKKTEELNDL